MKNILLITLIILLTNSFISCDNVSANKDVGETKNYTTRSENLDDNWVAMNPEIPGADDYIRAMVRNGDYLYVAGDFTVIKNIFANHIAALHIPSNTWVPLGSGINGTVYSLSIDNKGNLYAGGSFLKAGEETVNNIAKWDGTSWNKLENGVSGTVLSIASDNNGNIYAGGIFNTAGELEVNKVAKWDGTKWNSLGSGTNSWVELLVVDNMGNLYAGGIFSQAGEIEVDKIAKWDGENWHDIGSVIDYEVRSITIDNDNNLYVYGRYYTTGDSTDSKIVKWDGTNWIEIKNGAYGSIIQHEDGILYFGSNPISKWDGENWSEISGEGGSIETFAFDGNGNIYAGGRFTTIDELNVNYIAKWNTEEWEAIGNGINKSALDCVVDKNGSLYVAGEFNTAPDIDNVIGIIKWDEENWSNLKNGLHTTYGVSTLGIDNNDNIFASGGFLFEGDSYGDNNYIAKWDGNEWSKLGTGISNRAETIASDNNGILYIGGDFDYDYLYKWFKDSDSMSKTQYFNDTVRTLKSDIYGDIYAGGDFTRYNTDNTYTTLYKLAKIDGYKWKPLGQGFKYDDTINVIDIDKYGNLYAGGTFSEAGGVKAKNIAKWDGNEWSALGDGFNKLVGSITFDNVGNIYVSSKYATVGVTEIAKWDGKEWSTLGSGVNGKVNKLVFDNKENLYICGDFTSAGEKFSPYLAKYKIKCGNGIIEDDEQCELIDGNFGNCCDKNTCRYKSSDSICRETNGVCDAEEKCTGNSAECPEDIFLADGTSCDDENPLTESTTCLNGECIEEINDDDIVEDQDTNIFFPDEYNDDDNAMIDNTTTDEDESTDTFTDEDTYLYDKEASDEDTAIDEDAADKDVAVDQDHFFDEEPVVDENNIVEEENNENDEASDISEIEDSTDQNVIDNEKTDNDPSKDSGCSCLITL